MQVKVAPVSSTNLNGPWPLIFTGTMIAASLGGASSNGTSPGTVDAGVPKSFEAGSAQADKAMRSSKRDGISLRIREKISGRLTQMDADSETSIVNVSAGVPAFACGFGSSRKAELSESDCRTDN